MTAEPTDLNAVAERPASLIAVEAHLREMADRLATRLMPETHASIVAAAACVRLVTSIREPSPALVDAVSLAMRQSPAWAAVFGASTSDLLARAALRAIAERGAG